MQKQSKNKHNPLLCTYKDCKELQTEDGEFCEKHYPKNTTIRERINYKDSLSERIEKEQGYKSKKDKNHNQFIRCLEQIEDLTLQKHFEYALVLAGESAFSRKTIKYNPKTELFKITNHIDNTHQMLSKRQLMDKKVTHIGEAMSKRSLIALIP